MSSGIRYREPPLPVPWGDDVDTYYGTDLREVALNGTSIERPPGRQWHYDNYHPLLPGLVLERATGRSVSDYRATRLWRPLGAERAAIDLARFGLLFLHQGEWNGTRIVARDWVRAATAADTTTDPAKHYQYMWWVDTERPGRFYAVGNYGRYLYVAPDAGTVIVRNGRDRDAEHQTWLRVFRDVADRQGHARAGA
jgi:CubicO group peptidase (beta-lactamase class C family)